MGTTRRPKATCRIFDPREVYTNMDVRDWPGVRFVLASAMPDVIVNCVGIVRQAPAYRDAVQVIAVNALFPQQLATYCREHGIRMIHISSDCVWNGERGQYRDDEIPNGYDLYAHTKISGEVDVPGCLTLRTSFVGREIEGTYGLVEWFLSNEGGAIDGWRNAVFSGFTSLALSNLIADVIEHHVDLEGIYQVSTQPISKYDLLCLIRDAYGANIEINGVPEPHIDRSLDSTPFRKLTGFVPQAWPEMIAEMANDKTPYGEIRREKM
jgi:dTDP-4-dehydrorhamnose reductase